MPRRSALSTTEQASLLVLPESQDDLHQDDLNANTLAFGNCLYCARTMEIKKRRYWLEFLETLWEKRSVLWLSGARLDKLEVILK